MNRTAVVLSSSMLLLACRVGLAGDYPFADPVAHEGAQITVIASGLKDPRGMAISPDGELYVAEAGTTQGTFTPPPPPVQGPATRDRCEVFWPVGPATPGNDSRISRIGPHGQVIPVVTGIPSSAANTLIGGDRGGAAALTFVGNDLFAITSGAGCSHGHTEPNQLMQVLTHWGVTIPIADLSYALRQSSDSKDPAAVDFEPDGTWYSVIHTLGAFYSVEPNHGRFVRISSRGQVTNVADMIATVNAIGQDGDQTWTALIRHGAFFYFGTLGRIDTDFAGSIYRLSLDGKHIERVATGLHGVVGIAFDRREHLYALETTTTGVNPPLSDPTAGRLVRVERDGSLTPIVSNLAFPTALTPGRRGEFYIAQCGYHCDDHTLAPVVLTSLEAGQILKVKLPREESWSDDE
jgi:hypothetical protein